MQHSVKKIFTVCFILLLTLSLLLVIGYGIHSIRSYDRKNGETTHAYLMQYVSEFYEQMSEAADFYRNLAANDPDCGLLSLPRCSENQALLSGFNLRRIVQSRTPESSLTVLYNPSLDWLYYYYGDSIAAELHSPAKREFVRSCLADLLVWGEANGRQWHLLRGPNEETYLCAVCKSKKLYIAYMVCLNDYVRRIPVPVFSESDSPLIFCKDEILLDPHSLALQNIPPLDALTSGAGVLYEFHYQTVSVPELEMYVSVLTPATAHFRQVLDPIAYLAAIVSLLVAALFAAWRILLRLLVLPLEEVASVSHAITANQTYGSTAVSRFKEFNDIHRSILDLVEQKGNLEAEKRRQELLNERTAFQYYQLQTRSHFFLNCLKSLYSLTESGNREKMQLMIRSFSNHLRYIFHDNMKEVTLKAELQEVADYHRIITLDCVQPFLLSVDAPEQLMDCLVPPLLIQTFLENTYKYSGHPESILLFGVDISTVYLYDIAYLRVKLYDNGAGYPESVLGKINSSLTDSFDENNVGINNLRRRMDILYQGKCQTAFMNNPGGGACSILFLPVRRDHCDEDQNDRRAYSNDNTHG